MSSETPAERPTDTPDDSGGGRPRRAMQPSDQAPHTHPDRSSGDSGVEAGSPATPVRFHDRLAARARRAEAGEQRWSWELPPAAAGTSATADDRTAGAQGRQGDDQPAEDQPADDDQGAPRARHDGRPAEGSQPTHGRTEPADQTGQQTAVEVKAAPDLKVQPEQASGANAWIAAGQPSTGETTDKTTDETGDKAADQTGAGATEQATAKAAGVEGETADEPEPALGPDGKPLPKPTGFGTPTKPTKKPVRKPARKPAKKPAGRQRFRLLEGMAPMAPREAIPDQSHLPANQRTDLAARVTNLSVTYRTSFEKKPTLRQAIVRLGRGQRAVREIKALQDISFEVKTGSSVGIIGRNGAGKSTLMRTLSGTLPPTEGTVEVWGKASTLLALGVNFNHVLSGRENIILGGLAAGMTKDEVVERANEIAEWTELGDFIDMPMRTYSSGMAARVSFAVAVHMEPDILMIDEGMSTGDAHFKDKAAAKMAELRDKARAMFLVSHGLGSITELCDQAIWLDKGRLIARGEPGEVVDKYLSTLRADKRAQRATDLEDV